MSLSNGEWSPQTMESKMTASLLSTDGNDQINGTVVPDFFDTLLGDDIVFGGGGSDVIFGNEGNDTLYADTYAGYAGADVATDWNVLLGGNGDDTLISGVGQDGLGQFRRQIAATAV